MLFGGVSTRRPAAERATLATRNVRRPTPRSADKALPAAGQSSGKEVYSELRELIIRLELPPGSATSEIKLAHTLHSGPGPIRYAVQRLSNERLLNVTPRGQTLVAPMTITEVAQSYQVRTSLEMLGARRAALQGLPTLPDRLGELVIVAEAEVDARNFQRTVDISRVFWDEFISAAQNEILSQAIFPLSAITQRFEYFIAARHQIIIFDLRSAAALIDAIRAKDPDTAEDVVKQKIGAARGVTCSEFLNVSLGA